MWLVLYGAAFWIFAALFMLIKSSQEGELAFARNLLSRVPLFTSAIIKAMPAALATLFILLLRPSGSLFYLLMALGLLLCLFGDVGMEIGLLPGIALFTLAQIDFTAAFITQSVALGITPTAILPMSLVTLIVVVCVFFLYRYLQSSEQGLGKFLIPVIIYIIVISAMLCSSILLWLTSGILMGGVVAAGAVLFVISDSLIGVREFHHRFPQTAIKVLGTYYLAIFLLSLTVLVYQF